WLITTAFSLTGVASTFIDHVAEIRCVAALRPFTALGTEHPAFFAYEYCRLVLMLSEDRLAEAHTQWLHLLSRVEQSALVPRLRNRIYRGALCALGVLECQRDDSAALARIRSLEELGGPLDIAFANQLKFLYHGFRGEIDVAKSYRDRVEEYAVQYGSAWQVEIWSTSTSTAIYGNTRDVAGAKRVVEQLERLKKT